MISQTHRFIYLHVPKTGGNSIQHVLLPFSDDRRVCNPGQDGHDRFGVTGPVTPRKHARLAEYADALGDALADYRIVISVRHPFERAISAYFSRHRWIRQTPQGPQPVPPKWDETAFFDLLARPDCAPACMFLQLGAERAKPDLVVRFETLATDLRHAGEALGLPPEALRALPHVNRSSAGSALRQRLLASPALRLAVEARYGEDMAAFGYAPYTA